LAASHALAQAAHQSGRAKATSPESVLLDLYIGLSFTPGGAINRTRIQSLFAADSHILLHLEDSKGNAAEFKGPAGLP
jgi:hypothetical protein